VPKNLDALAEIVHAVDVPLEIGGGVRTTETVQRYFSLGISRIVIGTRALNDPEWFAEITERFPGRIVAGVDARDGRVAVKGWVETSDVDAFEFARQIDSLPLAAIVFTDVATDGAMQGPNLAALQRMTDTVDTPVVASGGISTLEDVERVAQLRVEGMIIGRALFDGAFTLQEAIAKTSRGQE
jgi:phosphoribosylformimino-5-aminoimidazole carboxamide ribotide isomerase